MSSISRAGLDIVAAVGQLYPPAAIGKLEVVAGDFDAAQQDFLAVTRMERNKQAQAEANGNLARDQLLEACQTIETRAAELAASHASELEVSDLERASQLVDDAHRGVVRPDRLVSAASIRPEGAE